MSISKNKKAIIGISTAVVLIIAAVILVFGFEGADSDKIEGTEYAQLTYAPNVPQPFTRDYPAKVIVKLEKALAENPTYVVFNGSVGALTGENAIHAKVGQTIRLFVGNIGPNLTSSFHIIGVVFDKAYAFGGTEITQKNVQTINIPAGGAAVVEFKVQVPGTYTIVDHSIFRAFNKGAVGSLIVTGDENKNIFSGKQQDNLFYGSDLDKDVQASSSQSAPDNFPSSGNNIEDIVAAGKKVFLTTCFACHQPDAKGIPGVFPPLAGSDFLNANKERAIGIVLHGKTGPVIVNGKQFNNIMPPQPLNDDQIAAMLTYLYHSFGNSRKTVTKEEVTKIRSGNQVSLK